MVCGGGRVPGRRGCEGDARGCCSGGAPCPPATSTRSPWRSSCRSPAAPGPRHHLRRGRWEKVSDSESRARRAVGLLLFDYLYSFYKSATLSKWMKRQSDCTATNVFSHSEGFADKKQNNANFLALVMTPSFLIRRVFHFTNKP